MSSSFVSEFSSIDNKQVKLLFFFVVFCFLVTDVPKLPVTVTGFLNLGRFDRKCTFSLSSHRTLDVPESITGSVSIGSNDLNFSSTPFSTLVFPSQLGENSCYFFIFKNFPKFTIT